MEFITSENVELLWEIITEEDKDQRHKHEYLLLGGVPGFWGH